MISHANQINWYNLIVISCITVKCWFKCVDKATKYLMAFLGCDGYKNKKLVGALGTAININLVLTCGPLACNHIWLESL